MASPIKTNVNTAFPGALDNFGAGVWDPAIGLAVDALEQQSVGGFYGVYNVVSYGADPTGTNDSTVAIQAAINACQTAGGGTVFFPVGNYHVTPVSATVAALTITQNNVTLKGANKNGAFLRKTGNGLLLACSGSAAGSANHLEYIVIEDLAFHGANFTGTMIQCYYCDDFTFNRCYFTQNADIVIDTTEFWDSRINDCYFDTNGGVLGTTAGTTPNVYLRNSAASSGFGYSTDSVNQIYLTDNHFESFTDGAVKITAGVGNTNNPNGIYITNDKMEASHILTTQPYLWTDTYCQQIFVNNVYVYVGGFGSGFSTAITAIEWQAFSSDIQNVVIANSGTATIAIGMDWLSATRDVSARNIIGRYGTAPTTAHVNFNSSSTGNFVAQNLYAPTGGIQFAGNVPNFVGATNFSAYVSGEWYPNYELGLTTVAPTTGKLYAYPFVVTATHQFTALGIWVTAGGTTAVLRFGIYADNGGTPVGGALILDASTATANSSGAASQVTGLTQWLEPGVYWLCVVQNSASSGCTINAANDTRNSPIMGQTALAAALAQNSGFIATGTGTTGTLPATFPAASAGTNIPLVLALAA